MAMEHNARFEAAVAELAARFGPAQLRALADRVAAGRSRAAILQAVPVAGFAGAAAAVLDARTARG